MNTPRRSPFSGRAVLWMGLVGGVSLVAAFVLSGLSDRLGDPRSAGADSFSRSAVGHHAWVRFLEERGLDVRTRRRTATSVPDGGLWAVVEPPPRPAAEDGDVAGSDPVADILLIHWIENGPILLVPPKWIGEPDPSRPEIVYRAFHVPDPLAAGPFDSLETLTGAALDLRSGTESLSGPCAAAWDRSYDVDLIRPRFVEVEEGWTPILSCDDGVLAAVAPYPDGGDDIVVVADPDLLSNHGIGRAAHAAFVADLVERYADGSVLVDETVHGHDLGGNVLGEMMRFPLVLLVLHGLLLAAVATWAGAVRFGAVRAGEPPLGRGRQVLIDNVADLIAVVGRTADLIDRYERQCVRAVAHHYGWTSTGSAGDTESEATTERLREIERVRKVEPGLDRIRREQHPSAGSGRRAVERNLQHALRLHRWKTEMTHVD